MYFTLDTKKSGIVELDNENKVVAFLEKPDPTTTSSRWAVSN
jgi:dTDP-glucose pyrophosphorylase